MKKNILSFVLTCALVLSMVPVAGFAAGTAKISVKGATAVKAGEVNNFSVQITDNPGFCNFSFRYLVFCGDIDVTEKFVHTKDKNWVTKGDFYTNTISIGDSSNIVAGYGDSNITTASGTLYSMSLTPDADLVEGTYTIKIALTVDDSTGKEDPSVFSDEEGNQVSVEFLSTQFTLTGGLPVANVTPTVTVSGTTSYSYASTAPTPTALTANAAVAQTGGSLTYQWYENDQAIDGATNQTYTPALPAIGTSVTYKCEVKNTYNGLDYVGISAPVTVSYNRAEITGKQAVNIAAPTKNGTPQGEIKSGSTNNYTGAITWDPTVAADGKFAADTAYTATVTLTAKENYKFASGVTAEVQGATVSDATVAQNGTTFTFKAAFPKTLDKVLTSISVTTDPTQKIYQYGDTLDAAGMVVTGTYDDNSTAPVTGYTVKYGTNTTGTYFSMGDTSVTIDVGGKSATVSGFTVNKKAITVKAEDKTRPYGQAANPKLTWAVGEGSLVGSDTKDALTVNLVCSAVATTSVGTVDIAGTGSATNYEITVEKGTLTITPVRVNKAVLGGNATLTVSKAQVTAANSLTALGLPEKATLKFSDNVTDADVNATYDKTLDQIKAVANSVDANSGDKAVDVTLTKACFPAYADAGSSPTMPRVTIKITNKYVIPEGVITFNDITTTYGTDYTPSATVTADGNKYDGVTYTYTYQKTGGAPTTTKPKDAGTYTVTVTVENDNYKGTESATLTINKKTVTAVVTAESKTYDGTNAASVTAVVGSGLETNDVITIVGLTGTFSDANVGNDKAVTVDTSKAKVTGTGSGNYTITYAVNDVKANITAKAFSNSTTTEAIADQEFTGSTITPAVVVKDGGRALIKDTDYTVAYTNNTDVGNATVTVTGKGNYSGTKTATFRITAKSIAGATISEITAQVFTGTEIEPAVTVTLGGTTLSGGDYDVVYSNNINAGTAAVTVTGKGNYSGTVRARFTINPKALDADMVEITGTYTYNGSPVVPTVTVKDGTALTVADYKLSYSDNINAGTATVTVMGQNNYSGTVSKTFTIDKQTLTPQTVITELQSVADKTTEVDLSSLVPGNCGGTVIYSVTNDTTHVDGNTVTDNKLTLTYKGTEGAEEDESLTVKVAGMNNYNDFDIIVNIKFTTKEVVKLRITPNANLTYDGTAKTAAATGAPEGVNLVYTYTGKSAKGETYAASATAPTNAGTYTVIAAVETNDAYTGTATANFIITPANATIKANDVTITAGDALPAYTSTSTPVEVPVTGVTVTCPTGDKDVVGIYPIVAIGPSVSDDGNYNLTYVNGTLTVNKQTVATPTASPNGGTFTDSTSVTLACSTEGAKIYYTINGSEPTADSTEYTTAINVTDTTTIKAIAVKDGMNNSAILSAVFTKQNSTGGSTSGGSTGGGSTTGKTETTTKPDGTVVTTTKNSDGSTTTKTKVPDGTTATVNVSANGKTTVEVNLSATAGDGKTAALPIPEVEASSDSKIAPSVTVKTADNKSAKVEIPVSNANVGTVAVLVKADGTEQIVKTTVPTEKGITITVNNGDTVKIVDNSKSFIDTTSHWGKEPIQFVSSRELFLGTSPTEFSPNSNMTRGMLMTVLARFEDISTEGGATWYEKGVSWAKNNGLSDGTNPNANITREQLVTILYRYAKSNGADTNGADNLSGFRDSAQVSVWAKDAMNWAVSNGIIVGSDGAIKPQNNATRTEVATVIMRYAQKFVG